MPFITADASVPKQISMKLSRAKFEQMCEDLVERSRGPCLQALKDSGLDQVDEAILVGGSTRIPKVQELVKDIFGREPHRGVNPDEVVALGAAVQAGVLGGEVKDVLLLDVTPLSLGIETLGGVMTSLIQRNTTIPTKKSEIFSTAADNQTTVEIHVLQGERQMAQDSRTLGRFHLVGIPPAPRGIPQVEVTFDLDANGIVSVAAIDKATGQRQTITITASSGLAEDEIEQMVKDADLYAEEDRKRREHVEARNALDNLVYQVEKTLSEHRDKLSSEDVSSIEVSLKEARDLLESEDTEKIKAATETLMQASHKLAEHMYQTAAGAEAGAGPGPEGAEEPKPPDEDVVDAEFEDVDKS